MQLYLAAAPDRLSALSLPGVRIAHAAYRIGTSARLLTRQLPARCRGGLLLLSDTDAPPVDDPDALCRALVQECARRGFQGVVTDFEAAPTADRARLIRRLDEVLPRQRLRLYVPEYFAPWTRNAAVLVGTVISGGTLQRHLSLAVERYGAARVALDCQRLAMDYLLPSPNGEGVPLSPRRLAALRQGRQVFFAQEPCARYFTYRTGESFRFVLFDDADTLRRKLALAESLGISTAFLMLPEVEDLLPELFGA